MTRSMIYYLILVGMTIMASQRAGAASAVAWDGGSNVITSAGQFTERLAKYDALSTGRKKFGANVRVIASTGRSGYGAIAVAGRSNGHGTIIGIVLGRDSQCEADRLAMGRCLKAGGVWPEVRWRIKG
jgi:hypothetical protein